MKKSFAAFLLSCLAVASVQARTWTSADGTKTFSGELKSYNAETGMVTVTVNGRALEFPQDKLSAADVAFLKENAAGAPSASSTSTSPGTAPASTAMAERMAKVKLSRLDGKRYKRAELEKTPDYYILYYSASW